MANLKNIRSQIKSVTSIQKVTKAMKMVAAAKLRKSQDNMEKARPYSNRIKELIASLINDVDRNLLPLLNAPSEISSHGFIIITADRGLAGSFNTNIIKKTEKKIEKVGKENAYLFCVGKKGFEHFNKRNYNILNHYQDFWGLYNPLTPIRFSKIQHFLLLFFTTSNCNISMNNGRGKLRPGSNDAEFNVDIKNGLVSKEFLSRS